VRVYENTSDAQLGEMYAIETDLFFYAKGDPGNGIADITANADDTLTITMTDGTTYTTKAMRGEKGDKGEKGDTGTSIVSFEATGQTDVSVVYTVTFSDDTTQEVAVPKGPQGDTGLTGNGIASTTLNNDYTLTVNYTDGTSYTTPSIRGAQGVQGVSVIGFTQTGETETNTVYNLVFSDGRTQSVAIPKGAKGDKGDTGNTGAQGAQGPKGDTVTATDYTLYNVQGSDSQGAMSQDATTKAISAQTGYYTCGAAADKADKVAAVENGNLYKRTLGGHFKVKMTNKNTAASGVTLKIGSETAAPLLYNGEAVSASNSWEENEVISVYYDGTYYQASNAMGGGSAVGKKVINPTATNRAITTNGSTIGAVISTKTTNLCYAKYAVNEGDVVMISGTGGNLARLWAIADASENILSKCEVINATEEYLVLVMPAGAKWIVLNNDGNKYPDYKWYYAKAGSVGAHEMQTEAYLYGDLRTLIVGQTYKLNEAVKTADNQLFRMTKEINPANNTDEVAIGDLKVYGSGSNSATYKALKAVGAYNGIETDGLYTIGKPSVVTITVDSSSLSIEEDADITVTIGDDTQTITVPAAASETKDADIAALIKTAFTSVPGWNLTDNENGTLTLKCNTGGKNTIVFTSNVGDTGLVITSSAINGNAVLNQFSNGSWSSVTVANYIADTEMWESIGLDDLLQYTEQNSQMSYIKLDRNVRSVWFNRKNENNILFKNIKFEKGKTYHITIKSYGSIGTKGGTLYINSGIGRIPFKEEGTNNAIAISNLSVLANPYICTITPEASYNNCNLTLWISGNNQSECVEIETTVSWSESAVSLYDKVSYDEGSESKKSLISVTKTAAAYTRGFYVYANYYTSIALFGSLANASDNTIYSTDYLDCKDAVKVSTKLLISKATQLRGNLGLVFYDSDKNPIKDTPTPYCVYNSSSYGSTARIDIDVPQNAAFFRNTVWEQGESYTLYYKSSQESAMEQKEGLNSLSAKVEQKTFGREVGLYNLTGTKSTGYISGSNYVTSSSNYGYWYDVTFYAGKRIKLKSGSYNLFFSSQILTTNTPIGEYALGDGYVSASTSAVSSVVIPSPSESGGKVYCWICTYANSLTQSYRLYSIVDSVPNRIEYITEDAVYSQDKVIFKARYRNDSTTNVGFLHFSDLHGDHAAMMELQDYISHRANMIDAIIETGDTVRQSSVDWKPKIQNDALFVLGNHDAGYYTHVRSDEIGREACYNYYFAPYLSAWKAGEEGGIHMGERQYAMYWYKDFQNVRLIGLDCMHFMGRDNITENDQETWFEETLNDAKENNLKVMVACHFGLDDCDGRYAKWDESTHKWKYNYINDSTDNNGGILMNPNTGRPVPFHWYGVDRIVWDKNKFTMRMQQECDGYPIGTNRFGDILSNWVADGGVCIAWIGGHVHQNLAYYPSRYPNILCIHVANAGSMIDAPGEFKRNNGVHVRLMANLYYINGDYLNIIRIGDNIQSGNLIPASWMSINYKTGGVAACY